MQKTRVILGITTRHDEGSTADIKLQFVDASDLSFVNTITAGQVLGFQPDGTRLFYLKGSGTDSLSFVKMNGYEKGTIASTGSFYTSLCFTSDSKIAIAWIGSLAGSEQCHFFDLENDVEISAIDTSNNGSVGSVVSRDDKTAYFMGPLSAIALVDVENKSYIGKRTFSGEWGGGGTAGALAVDHNDGYLYISFHGSTGNIYRLNTSTNAIDTSFIATAGSNTGVGTRLSSIVVDPQDEYLYALNTDSNGDYNLYKLELSTKTIVGTYPLAGTASASPQLKFHPADNNIIYVSFDDELKIFDVGDDDFTQTLALPGYVVSFDVAEVTYNPSGMVFGRFI